LRDGDTLDLIAHMLGSGSEVFRSQLAIETLGLAAEPIPPGCGIPLGGYLSHWSGGLYLNGLDHFVKRTLKVRGYLRYMDDFTLFGDCRRELEDHREAIREWLRGERRLELKRRRDGVRPTTQPSTFLGFRVSRAGVLPGPKAKRRLRRRLKNVETTGTEKLVRSLKAYRGLLLSV
jgi:hypothetical protein